MEKDDLQPREDEIFSFLHSEENAKIVGPMEENLSNLLMTLPPQIRYNKGYNGLLHDAVAKVAKAEKETGHVFLDEQLPKAIFDAASKLIGKLVQPSKER